MSFTGLALVLWGAFRVEGSSSCPSPAEVAAQLKAQGVETPDGSEQRIVLEDVPEGLSFRLLDVGGAALGQRTFAPSATCPERALAVATLVGAWEWQRPPAPPNRTPREAPGPSAVTRPRLLKPARPWEVGLGASASLGVAGLSPGGELFGSVGLGPTGWGADLALLALGSQDTPFAGGTVSWERFALGLGPRYRIQSSPVHIDLALRALAAFVHLHTADFLPPSANASEWGASFSLRAQPEVGPIRLWVALTLVAWPARPALQISSFQSTTPLTAFEFLVSEGLAFGRP